MTRSLAVLALAASACGTYSTLRPATVARPGHVELHAGVAVNQIGEVLPAFDGRVGLWSRLELGAHYEVYSGFVEARVQVLRQEDAEVSLAVGAGGGFATTLLDELGEAFSESQDPDPAAFLSLAISRRWSFLEPYVAARGAALFGTGFVIAPTGGLTFHVARWFAVSVEGGAAVHTREGFWLGVAQGALGIAFRL